MEGWRNFQKAMDEKLRQEGEYLLGAELWIAWIKEAEPTLTYLIYILYFIFLDVF